MEFDLTTALARCVMLEDVARAALDWQIGLILKKPALVGATTLLLTKYKSAP